MAAFSKAYKIGMSDSWAEAIEKKEKVRKKIKKSAAMSFLLLSDKCFTARRVDAMNQMQASRQRAQLIGKRLACMHGVAAGQEHSDACELFHGATNGEPQVQGGGSALV